VDQGLTVAEIAKEQDADPEDTLMDARGRAYKELLVVPGAA